MFPFENDSTRIVEAFSKRKAPDVNANFCIFESQCPKIMVLSKALKARLSSIPSSVADLSTPGLDLKMTMAKTATAVTGPHSTTRCGDHAQWGPLSNDFAYSLRGTSSALSLSEGR